MKKWWKEAVVYQVYPRSFMDLSGDGIGDLNGITSKLEYLSDLGVNIIWISPCYKSPNDDNGYDISDYRDIMTEFGTLDDFKNLLDKAHSLNLKIVMDLVINHCSDEHEWFKQGRMSKDNPYHDYFIWRNNPNNWQSFFAGSAWEYNPPTDEYYLHLFTKKQPDFNWENENLRRELYDMINYWLDMGVDGFRMDTVTLYSKVPGLPDVNPPKVAEEYFMNGPKMHEYLQEEFRNCYEGRDVVTIGEAPGLEPEEALMYVRDDRQELNMLFQFEHVLIDSLESKWDIIPYEPLKLKNSFAKWQRAFKNEGWNSLYLNNHDQPRSVSRFGDDVKYRKQSAKMLATLTHTLKGTPYIYQGEEIGMTNLDFAVDEYRDVEILNTLALYENTPALLEGIKQRNRDNSRTPMQWNCEQNAGFSTASKTWIKVNPNYTNVNVEEESRDADSILNYYKKLIALRKQYETLIYGDFTEIIREHPNIFAFYRNYEGESIFVALNLSGKEEALELPNGKLLISNYDSPVDNTLRAYEALVIKVI